MRFLKDDRYFFYFALGILPFFYLDKAVSSSLSSYHQYNPALYSLINMIAPLIGFVSNGATLIIGSLLVCLFYRSSDRRLYLASRGLLLGLLSSGITVQILKHLIGRARPRITFDSVFIGPSFKGGYDSFPSGHTTLAFCLAIILSGHFPRYRYIFYAFAFVVCLYRLEGPAHFLTDILAGALLGTFVGKWFAGTNNPGEDFKPLAR